MKTLDKAELAFLAILGSKDLLRKALLLYKDNTILFHSVLYPHLNIMWKAYLNSVKKAKETGNKVHKNTLAAELLESVKCSFSLSDDFKSRCDTILQYFLEGDIPSDEEGNSLIQYLVKLDTNRKISAKVTKNADLDELQRTLDASKRALISADIVEKQTSIVDRVLFEPFKEIDSLAVTNSRIPTGINWLDEVSSGGGRPGELWLLLGSSGGGKTAIAVQYACAQALMGNSTVWATYEQSLEGDISERIIANVTDTSLDDIRDVGFNNMDKSIQDKFWASVAGSHDKLKVLDMTRLKIDPDDPKDNGGMYSVWKYVKMLKAEGHPIKTVLIDWFGAMLLTVSTIAKKDLSSGYRFAAQAEIDIARQMVKEENIMIIFFHQTDSKSQHARPTYIPDKTCSKDMKDMCNYMDLVFTLGTRDKQNVCWFSAAKSRKGAAQSVTIQLIGEKAKFILAKGYKPNRDGNFYKPSQDYNVDTNFESDSYRREVD